MNEVPLGVLGAILVVLIILSGFFSSSETGMLSINRFRLKHLRSSGHRGAKRVGELIDRPDRLIGLILIGNNLVNILASSIATLVAIRLWGDAGIAIATLVLTLVILIFAEITPKTIAALHPERVAFPASALLLPMMKLLYPAVWMVNQITNGLLRLLGIDPTQHGEQKVSVEELRTIVGDASSHLSHRNRGMLLNILDLEQVTVDDIMIPRNEVFGINLDDDDDTILNQLQQSEFTRVPIYQEDINNVQGILHLRKMSRIMDDGRLSRAKLLAEMREAYFVPESTPLHTQLMNFQREKRRIGIVVDEYGAVMGLVTLEDILEEIVGEFTSNLDDQIPDIHPQNDGSYEIEGTASIRDINKSLGWNLPTDGPKTLNGLLLEYLESFPDGNAGLRIGDYYLEILQMKGNLIERVRADQSR